MPAPHPTLDPAAAGATLAAAGYLGPAMVTAVDPDGRCRCLLGDAIHPVVPAMPIQYRAVVGDVLLVVADANRSGCYAIGVIQGAGEARLATAGSLELSAGAALRLRSGAEIEIDSPRTRLRGRRLELEADHLVTTVKDWMARVRDLFKLSSKRRIAEIEEADVTRSGSISTKAQGRVAIDGERIDIG
jgi:hypothetical protein